MINHRASFSFIILAVAGMLQSCHSSKTSTTLVVPEEKTMTKETPKLTYPVTKKIPVTDTYFGTPVTDDYQWLENDTSAATESWVKAQNAVTQEYLSQIPYRDSIAERLKDAYNYARVSSPMKAGKYIIYQENSGLMNQPRVMIKETWDGTASVLIDPNQMDAAGTTALNLLSVSEDLRYLAVSISKAGSDWAQIRFIDLNTKKWTDDVLDWVKFSDATWKGDGIYYSRYPEPIKGTELSAASEYMSIYYHKMGQGQEEDLLVYKDAVQPKHYHYADVVGKDRYLILYKSTGTNGFETYYQDLYVRMLNAPFQPLFQGFDHKSVVVGFTEGKFLVHTDIDAPNYRLIMVDPAHPEKENWKDVVPQNQYVLENVYYHDSYLLLVYMENATNKLYTIMLDGRDKREVNLPGIGTVTDIKLDKTDGTVFYMFRTFLEPLSAHFFNIKNANSTAFFRAKLTFNAADYTTEQIWYTSKDGVKVPMFLVHKKDLVKDGSHPCLMYGYGGFNISETPSYLSRYIPLLEKGVIFALPNLRGGGEFGEKWHQAGMLFNKQTVFNDYISAAEFLIKEKYTTSDKLGISGGSNGGLLVGACMTQRPDLFKVAFPAVGVLDMLKFQRFTVGWGWVPEYGSSDQSKEMFQYLYGYSPYHNLKQGVTYPATMVTTGDHDDRVVPAHSFKFAAKLQECHDGIPPVLIRVETNAGHGAGKPVSKQIQEYADMWAFFLWNIGVKTW